MNEELPELLTRKEACARLRISMPTLNRRIQSGALRIVKLGTAGNSPVRIRSADLDAYIDGGSS